MNTVLSLSNPTQTSSSSDDNNCNNININLVDNITITPNIPEIDNYLSRPTQKIDKLAPPISPQ